MTMQRPIGRHVRFELVVSYLFIKCPMAQSHWWDTEDFWDMEEHDDDNPPGPAGAAAGQILIELLLDLQYRGVPVKANHVCLILWWASTAGAQGDAFNALVVPVSSAATTALFSSPPICAILLLITPSVLGWPPSPDPF